MSSQRAAGVPGEQTAWNYVVLPPQILPEHGYNLGNPGLLCAKVIILTD